MTIVCVIASTAAVGIALCGQSAATPRDLAPLSSGRQAAPVWRVAPDLQGDFTASGIRLLPASSGKPRWQWGLALAQYGAEATLSSAAASGRSVRDGRVDYLHTAGISEWYAARDSGVDHRLTLGFPPYGPAASARVEFALATDLLPRVSGDGRGIDFFRADGEAVMRYALMGATGAAGEEVSGRLEASPTEVSLVLSTTQATFPIDVWLSITSAAESASGGGGGGGGGGSITSVPSNDECAGAESIPGTGPFPYFTSVTPDVSAATTTGDPPLSSCQTNVSRSIWYEFTPTVTASYVVSSCADVPTGTTLDDTVIAVYTSSDGTCSGTLAEIPTNCIMDGCDDDSCSYENQQALVSTYLNAGTRYFIVVWQYTNTAPASDNVAVQLAVTQSPRPSNDACAGAIPVGLNATVKGTTAGADNDAQLSGSTCFTGVGQTASAAAGKDVIYSFTAPSADNYSFKVANYSTSMANLILYVASSCPAGPPPAVVSGCLGAANRFILNSSEEVMCVPLSAGQQVFVFVDEDFCTQGSDFSLEVNRCARESEPNGSTANANALVCGIEGSIATAGEIDFYTLGVPGVDSRVFALADGVAANSSDFDMRVTTTSDTLEYDDLNNDNQFGSLAPNVGGVKLTGVKSFLRLNHFAPGAIAEPYRLYSAVQPPSGTASTESEPNDTLGQANTSSNNYYSGTFSSTSDVDLFAFTASAGDLIGLGLDGDPLRNLTPINGALTLLDSAGNELIAVNDNASGSNPLSGAGSLTSTVPQAPAEALTFRAVYTGTYYARAALSFNATTPGDYLLSIALNCKVFPGTDLVLRNTATPTCVIPGNTVTYTLTATNNGPATARNVTVTDPLASSVSFVSVTTTQGTCYGTSTVVCNLGDVANGATVTITIGVTANTSSPITSTASATTDSLDPNLANNYSLASNNASCQDGNACTTNDMCSAGTCIAGPPPNCDDANLCTDDSCNPAIGCVNAPNTLVCNDGNACTTADRCSGGVCVGGPAPNCNDGNVCTDDACNPVTGCVNTDNADFCNDGNACTTNDSCNARNCVGGAPPNCDDGNVCTNDSCNTTTGCVNAANTATCDDGISCTTGDVCSAGTCGGHNVCCDTPDPKNRGYYKRLCAGPHSGDALSQADVDCVNDSCTFGAVTTIAQLCNRIDPTPASDKCEQAESQLMALLLNRCRYRACNANAIDSNCTTNTTVAQSVSDADSLTCSPTRTQTQCNRADCEATEINNGRALKTNSNRVVETQAGSSGTFIVSWEASLNEQQGLLYNVWRRPVGTSPWVVVGQVVGFTFTDSPPAGDFEYLVTSSTLPMP